MLPGVAVNCTNGQNNDRPSPSTVHLLNSEHPLEGMCSFTI